MSSHLEGQRITNRFLAEVLYKLPDSEYGADTMPDGYVPYCVRCDDQITDAADLGVAYGRFVHRSCVQDGEGDAH